MRNKNITRNNLFKSFIINNICNNFSRVSLMPIDNNHN